MMLAVATVASFAAVVPAEKPSLRRTTGDDQPPANADDWDDWCKYQFGVTSYCKYWLDNPHCHKLEGQDDSEVACYFADTPPAVHGTTAAPTTTAAPAHVDDRDRCDNYCKSLNDGVGYCKWWKEEPICKHGNQPCGSSTTCDYDPADLATTAAPVDDDKPDVRTKCDKFCKGQNSGVGYCKWWMPVPTCKHGDQPCGTEELCGDYDSGDDSEPEEDKSRIQVCDDFCKAENGVNSFCKYWLDNPVCKGGDQPCGSREQCVVSGTTAPSSPTKKPKQFKKKCDDYCAAQNGGSKSWCKWWLDVPVCKGGDQPCGAESECYKEE